MNRPPQCPVCGSDRIQKAKIIMKTGILISTDVSKKLSPPAEPTSTVGKTGWLALYTGALPLFLGIYTRFNSHAIHSGEIGIFLQTLGCILIFLGISLWMLSQIELNSKKPKYTEDYAKWEHLWYCSHCSNTFYNA